MSPIKVTVLMNKLPSIRRSLRPKVAKEVETAGLNIENGAKQRVRVKTGTLRRSIHTTKTGEMSLEVGPSVEYGLYQEFGTRRMAAHPYLIPAAEAESPHFITRVKKALEP